MTVAHSPPRGARSLRAIASAWACVVLAGCAATQNDASALLPPAGIAEAKGPGGDRAKVAAGGAESCDASGGAVGVEDMLKRAREPGAAATAAPAKPCPPGAGSAKRIETGSIGAGPAREKPVEAAGGKSASGVDGAELFIDFEPGAVTLPDKSRRQVQDAVAARMLNGATRARIVAARGSSGNLFDQAVVAQKRARVVNELLPPRMVDSVEFDPSLPEDTVRIEFKTKSAAAHRVP